MSDTVRRRITRAELYDLVWKKAMWKLAPEFGLSGNGLAKLCRRHDIPVPDRGYWAKLQHRKKVRRPPLPPAKPGQSEEIVIESSPPGPKSLEACMPEALANLLAAEREQTEQIVVPVSPKPHRIVASWSKPQKPIYGVALWSPATEARRRRIASVLFREIEKRGGTVSSEEGELRFSLLGASIEVSLRERTKMVKIPADPKVRYSYDRAEWHPTGLLRLRFENYFDVPVRREWNETEEKPLESKLREIIVGWFVAVEAERRRNERFARERQEREEAQLRRQQLEDERRKERKRIDSLLASAKSWEDAARIRSYVVAVVAKDGDAADSWAKWAIGVADAMDPVLTSACHDHEGGDS